MKKIKYILPFMIIPFLTGCSTPTPFSKGRDIDLGKLQVDTAFVHVNEMFDAKADLIQIPSGASIGNENSYYSVYDGNHITIKSIIGNKTVLDTDATSANILKIGKIGINASMKQFYANEVLYVKNGVSNLLVFDNYGNTLLEVQGAQAEVIASSSSNIHFSLTELRNYPEMNKNSYLLDVYSDISGYPLIHKTYLWSIDSVTEIDLSGKNVFAYNGFSSLSEYGLPEYSLVYVSSCYNFYKDNKLVSTFDTSGEDNTYIMGNYVFAQSVNYVTGDDYDFVSYDTYLGRTEKVKTVTRLMDIRTGQEITYNSLPIIVSVSPLYESTTQKINYSFITTRAADGKILLDTYENYLVDRDMVIHNQVDIDDFMDTLLVGENLLNLYKGRLFDQSGKILLTYNTSLYQFAGANEDFFALYELESDGMTIKKTTVYDSMGKVCYTHYGVEEMQTSGKDFVWSDSDLIYDTSTKTEKFVFNLESGNVFPYVYSYDDLEDGKTKFVTNQHLLCSFDSSITYSSYEGDYIIMNTPFKSTQKTVYTYVDGLSNYYAFVLTVVDR